MIILSSDHYSLLFILFGANSLKSQNLSHFVRFLKMIYLLFDFAVNEGALDK